MCESDRSALKLGKCLIVFSPEAWKQYLALRDAAVIAFDELGSGVAGSAGAEAMKPLRKALEVR